MPRITHHRPDPFWEVTRWAAGLTALGLLVWAPRTAVLFFALCAGTPVHSYEADLNHDGYVSVGEAGYACNVDSRPVRKNGHVCQEYYNRVDWRPVTLVCE